MQCFPQSNSSNVKEIKAYRQIIDSLHNLHDSLRHALTDEAEAQLNELKLSERIGEGVFYKQGINSSETEGGFSVYTFFKNDSICRISFSGGRNDAYVTKDYYFRNNRLVFAEMKVRRWEDQVNKPYQVEEYYSGQKIIARKTENQFPKVSERSLVPGSLLEDGMYYFNLEW